MTVSIIIPAWNAKHMVVRALDSIPRRPDIEVLVCDDGSTDETWEVLGRYVTDHSDLNIRLFRNDTNRGVGYTRNVLLDNCQYDYVYGIDADDFIYTENFVEALSELDGTDMIYVHAKNNNEQELHVNDQTKYTFGAMWFKFLRRGFIGTTRCLPIRFGEDKTLNDQLLARKHTEKFLDAVVYHYNHPRYGSLCHVKFEGGIVRNKEVTIKLKNVLYFAWINQIGGVETMFYNLAKKYGKKYDITIFYSSGDQDQIERLRKYVRVIHYTGQHIVCDKLFTNFDTSIMDNVDAKEYICILHSDYRARKQTVPGHPKITKYIGVSENTCKVAEELSGHKVELCYNPLVYEEPKKVLHLVSATRLTKEKGKDRILQLAEALDKAGIPFIWQVFTNDLVPIKHPNIIWRHYTLNITDHLADADYVVQLSDTEGWPYTILESLQVGTPVIVCPWPICDELGLNETNSFILPFAMNDIPVDKIYAGLPPFKYKVKKDGWDKLLVPGKSEYAEWQKQMTQVRVTKRYIDITLDNRMVYPGEVLDVTNGRAELLIERGFAEYIDNGQTTSV